MGVPPVTQLTAPCVLNQGIHGLDAPFYSQGCADSMRKLKLNDRAAPSPARVHRQLAAPRARVARSAARTGRDAELVLDRRPRSARRVLAHHGTAASTGDHDV